jgi:hypothetical protein
LLLCLTQTDDEHKKRSDHKIRNLWPGNLLDSKSKQLKNISALLPGVIGTSREAVRAGCEGREVIHAILYAEKISPLTCTTGEKYDIYNAAKQE